MHIPWYHKKDGQTWWKMVKSTQFLTVDVEHEDDIGNMSPKLDSLISRNNKVFDEKPSTSNNTTSLGIFFECSMDKPMWLMEM